MRFVDLSCVQVAELAPNTVAVLPLGSIEQHGPHLPVSTDLITASEAATAAVDQAAGEVPVVLLPALAYTKSDEHAWSPGTLWLSWETMMSTLVDIGRSLHTSGIRRLLFINGHGGNSALGQVACRELRRRFGLQTFFAHLSLPAGTADRWQNPDELGMGIHGGHAETSLMMHLRPDLVNLELAPARVPSRLADYQLIGFGKPVSFGWLSDDFGPDGHIGDPTNATAEIGRELFGAIVGQLVSAIGEATRFSISPQ